MIEHLNLLEQAASPVKWSADFRGRIFCEINGKRVLIGLVDGDADLELIVTARNALPALLRAVRALEALLALSNAGLNATLDERHAAYLEAHAALAALESEAQP